MQLSCPELLNAARVIFLNTVPTPIPYSFTECNLPRYVYHVMHVHYIQEAY